MNFKRKLQAGLVKPFRSKAYREWVKSLECCGCEGQAEDAHHAISVGLGGGMGTKPSDLLCIPLCRICHTKLHESPREWELKNGNQMVWVYLTLAQAQEEGVITV